MKRFLSLLLVLLACLGIVGHAGAESDTVHPRQKPPWSLCRIYFDGLLSDRGFIREGTVFLSPDALCSVLGLYCSLYTDDTGFTLSLPGLRVSAEAGKEYAQADSRYLYLPEGWLVWEGRLYLPADAISRLFDLEIAVSEDLGSASLSPSLARLMEGGDSWYERHFRSEDIYWLEHIIVSESYQQPLAGQIGVGNVVLNRVADPRYPDTVMAVVIDREGGVQFDPAASGGVTMEPDEQSVVAARLCLEGYNTVGDCMYFLNPDKAGSRWFEENLTQAVTIGNHVFYH